MAAPELWRMDMHCLVGAYRTCMPSFSAIGPVVTANRDIAIVTKLTPLRFARDTCIRGHPHASGIVQYLVEGMKLPYKNYRM